MKRVAVITGATRGIGRGIALGLAKIGVDIAAVYSTDQNSADKLEKEIGARRLPH